MYQIIRQGQFDLTVYGIHWVKGFVVFANKLSITKEDEHEAYFNLEDWEIGQLLGGN